MAPTDNHNKMMLLAQFCLSIYLRVVTIEFIEFEVDAINSDLIDSISLLYLLNTQGVPKKGLLLKGPELL